MSYTSKNYAGSRLADRAAEAQRPWRRDPLEVLPLGFRHALHPAAPRYEQLGAALGDARLATGTGSASGSTGAGSVRDRLDGDALSPPPEVGVGPVTPDQNGKLNRVGLVDLEVRLDRGPNYRRLPNRASAAQRATELVALRTEHEEGDDEDDDQFGPMSNMPVIKPPATPSADGATPHLSGQAPG